MSNKVSFHIGGFLNPNLAAEPNRVKNGTSIFCGNMLLNEKKNPLVEQKKQLAGKQAMKLIKDAYAKDQKASDAKDALSTLKEGKVKALRETENESKSINEQMAALREEYGVEDDSAEQKDLDLLMRYQNAKNGVEHSDFSDEEKARLKELANADRSEYQSRALKLNDRQDFLRKQQRNLESEIQGLNASITDMGIEQLKSQDMQKAQDAADGIMDAAGKEVIGMLFNDGKDTIDKKIEEEKEKGEKRAEEQEKQEERIEEAKERRREQEEILEETGKLEMVQTEVKLKDSDDSSVAKAQQEIKKILSENNLLDEDIKGLEINLGF